VSLATYRDLCIDAADAVATARFWSTALRLEAAQEPAGIVRIAGPTPQHTVWVNPVPEPRAAKNRLHLDVHTSSVAELVAAGATVLTELPRWTVMADPDGGEFCAFVRDQVPPDRIYELGLDAADEAATAGWWATLLGAHVEVYDGFRAVVDIPGAPFESICVNSVPEPKVGRNRVHIDVIVDDLDALLAHGATLLRPRRVGVDRHVLADPEGNEFCAFAP
jgi:hypothetical protein